MPTETEADHGSNDPERTIRVDPADVIKALKYNEEEMAHSRSRTAEFRVWGDAGEQNAKLAYHERGSYFPAGKGPTLTINPRAFVCEDGRYDGIRIEGTQYPSYGDTRALVKDVTGAETWDDIDEELVDEWFDEAVHVWEGDVRAALRDEIAVPVGVDESGEIVERVAVEYVETDE